MKKSELLKQVKSLQNRIREAEFSKALFAKRITEANKEYKYACTLIDALENDNNILSIHNDKLIRELELLQKGVTCPT